MDPERELEPLAELEDRFRFHRRLEVEAEARDIDAARTAGETFRDFLRALPAGLVIGVVTVDGAELWGRVDAVGADRLRLAETPRDPGGSTGRRPRRLHDIRLDAVVRVVRDAEDWAAP